MTRIDTARPCEPDPELVERCHPHQSVWPSDEDVCFAVQARREEEEVIRHLDAASADRRWHP